MSDSVRAAAGRAIAAERTRAGLTQAALGAELGGIANTYVSGIETAAMQPSLELALLIQRRFEGRVRAAELRPDLADLIAEAARPAPEGVAA